MTAVAPSGGPIAASRGAGAAALALAGVLFGSTFLVVQDAVERASVTAFLAARFLLAAAVLWPIARRRPSSVDEVRHGVLAGLSLLAGYLLQTEGLRHTTSATTNGSTAVETGRAARQRSTAAISAARPAR